MAESAGATLVVARTHPADVQQRQVYVSLDGTSIATLLYGQSVERAIEPGEHVLRLNNTLVWKTVRFDARPGERVLDLPRERR